MLCIGTNLSSFSLFSNSWCLQIKGVITDHCWSGESPSTVNRDSSCSLMLLEVFPPVSMHHISPCYPNRARRVLTAPLVSLCSTNLLYGFNPVLLHIKVTDAEMWCVSPRASPLDGWCKSSAVENRAPLLTAQHYQAVRVQCQFPD